MVLFTAIVALCILLFYLLSEFTQGSHRNIYSHCVHCSFICPPGSHRNRLCPVNLPSTISHLSVIEKLFQFHMSSCQTTFLSISPQSLLYIKTKIKTKTVPHVKLPTTFLSISSQYLLYQCRLSDDFLGNTHTKTNLKTKTKRIPHVKLPTTFLSISPQSLQSIQYQCRLFHMSSCQPLSCPLDSMISIQYQCRTSDDLSENFSEKKSEILQYQCRASGDFFQHFLGSGSNLRLQKNWPASLATFS